MGVQVTCPARAELADMTRSAVAFRKQLEPDELSRRLKCQVLPCVIRLERLDFVECDRRGVEHACLASERVMCPSMNLTHSSFLRTVFHEHRGSSSLDVEPQHAFTTSMRTCRGASRQKEIAPRFIMTRLTIHGLLDSFA